MKADAALALCREYNLTDYYLDSCIFDLTTTGDPSFSLAAHRAQTDFVALMPDAHRRLANRTWCVPVFFHHHFFRNPYGRINGTLDNDVNLVKTLSQ